MGLSYIKMILREFKKSFGRFAAIFGIVALGVGFLSGLLITTPDMNNSVDTYYDNHNMADIFIKATMGLTEEDLNVINSDENVKDIMPAYVIDKLMELDGKETLTAKIYGIPLLNTDDKSTINKLDLLEGRMPENNRECLVERKSQYIKDIKIGSTLKISDENKDYDDINDLYEIQTYEVVGVVGNSFHFAIEREISNVGSGKLDTIIYVDRSSYALEEFTDFYIVLEDAMAMDSFSSDYELYTDKVRKRLEEVGKDRSTIRKNSILDEANKELEEGFEEYYQEKAKADKELADALKELNDGKKELEDAAIDIEKAKIELEDARKTLEKEVKDAEAEISDGEKDLKDAKLDLLDAEEKLKEAKIELEDGQQEYLDGYKDYEEGKKELEDGQRELNKAKNQIIISEIELEDGKKKLREGKIELEDAKRQLEKGESDYRDGLSDLRLGRREFLDGIEPIALELGYGYPEDLISTGRGQSDLKSYIADSRRQLEDGLSQAIDGRNQLESGIQELKAARDKKVQLENSLPGLRAQLQELEQGKVELEQGIEELKLGISLIETNIEGLQATITEKEAEGELFPEEELQKLKAQLAGLEEELIKLKAQLAGAEAQLTEVNVNIPKVIAGIDQTEAGIAEIDKNLQATPIDSLERQLSELNWTIEDLLDKQDEIPDPNFLIDTWNEIEDGERELNKAKSELDKGFRDYNTGLEELETAKIEIEDGEKKLADGKKEIQENEKKLEDAKVDLDKGLRELQDAKQELEDGKREYEDGLLEFKDGQKEYEEGLIEIEDAKITLKNEIADANRKIADGEKELQEGIVEYEDALIEIEDGEKEYADAKAEAEEELNDAYDELLEAEDEIRDLEDPEWYVLDRDSNMSYVSFQLNSDKVAAISTVFPIFFYLVAGLVALTTMTRMVEEERTQIGVLKALGYKKSTIILKYILYCGLASILGSLFGQMVGFTLIPRVIWNTYGVMYHLPEFITDYNQKIALLSSGVAIFSTIAATFFAANDALKEKPANLMVARAPKKGKRILLERITPLWSVMSFNLKSTARNIFRYKKHFYMTVIGVSGCTALLVTGFGLRDSIKDLGELQFDELFKYELVVQLEDDYRENVIADIPNNDHISDTLPVFSDEGYIRSTDKFEDITLVGIDNIKNISDYIVFRDRNNQQVIEFASEKIIISEKIADEFNIAIGDTVIYENSDEIEIEFVVDAITENYIGNYIYMDKNSYESAINSEVRNNVIYAKTGELDEDQEDKLIEDLYENDDILNAEFISQSRSMFDNLLESINYIVIVIIVASGLLAFIVLYNLTNININERKRELATLKVLGFHNTEVASYIFREITVLAFIGTLVGLVLGKYLHQFIIVTVEDPNFMFGRDISVLSYIIAAVITMLFSIIVDLFMVKKIRNIKMVDSMKAND